MMLKVRYNQSSSKRTVLYAEEAVIRWSKRVSHFTLLTSRKGGEWCARLHQRKDDQDWEIYRGDEENGSRYCERVWCIEKYSS